jgi:hypothetical protein
MMRAVTGGTWGCTSDIYHWRRNSSLTPHSPQQVLFFPIPVQSPSARSSSEMMTTRAWATTTMAFFLAAGLR